MDGGRGEGTGESAEEREERERHWQELLERRRERDRRLEEMEREGTAPTVGGAAGNEPEYEGSILERMREGGAAGQNPVHREEQEEARRAAAYRARAQRGLAAIAFFAIAAVVVFTLLGSADRYEVTAHFENAAQVVEGNEVTAGGTRIGTVDSVELGDNGEALVTFHVDESHAPLPEGTTATVRSFSLSGIANRQIQLTLPADTADTADGGEATDEIPDGGELTQADTVSEVDLDEIFNTLDDKTVADLKKVIRGFEVSTDGVGEQANEGFVYLNPFLSTSRRLFSELTLDERSLEQLIVDGSQLSGAVAAKRDDVAALVTNLNETMGAIGRQRTSLASAVSQLPSFMRNFNTTAVNLRATLDDLDPLVDASKPVAVKLRPFFSEFRAASANLVPTITDLDQVIETPGNNNDLVELTKLQNPLTKIAIGPVHRNGAQRAGAFPESIRSLNDSLKQLAFFRAYTPELTGWFDDFGHSGVVDANGGIGRIGTTFNTFSLSPNGLPDIGLPVQTQPQQVAGMDLGNLERCPGSNERPAPDGSNPFTDGGTLDCDPSQIPPGN
jgi:phospholipid/cholesterol/gamma-HCH transport system substrate-binding protein